MNYSFSLIKEWPKLAWVSEFKKETLKVSIHHGPLVETSKDWVFEGVWDKNFNNGDFDKTDLVFGSGVRFRDNKIIFVSPATGLDRIWYTDTGKKIFVSNNLPGLLKITGINLCEDYKDYFPDLASAERIGIKNHIKKIPSCGPDLKFVYYNNLVIENTQIKEIDKPFIKRDFSDFSKYYSFLTNTSKNLKSNFSSDLRKFKIEPLVGISSGYDSVAAAVISKSAGCKKAVSITNASSIWKRSDSGEKIAKYLDLNCRLYKHHPSNYKHEIASWASLGHSGGRNMTIFDYPKPLALFFSGNYGDTAWERDPVIHKEPKADIDMMMSEFRIIEGFFLTPVPWWGISQISEIQKIAHLKEMEPWRLNNNYDRPIARRIIEEAGIPRGEFAIKKYNTASNTPLWWPKTKKARLSLKNFLKKKGIRPINDIEAVLLVFFYRFIQLIYLNTAKKLKIKTWWRPWRKSKGRDLLFVWANHSLKELYPLDKIEKNE